MSDLPLVRRGARAPALPGSSGLAALGVAVAIGAFATAAGARGALLMLTAAALVPYVVVLAPQLRPVFLAMIAVDVLLQWDVNLGYREAVGELGAEAGLNVSLTTFALAGLFALWLSERPRTRELLPPARVAPALPLVAYLAVSALSIGVAREPALGGTYLVLLLQTALLFLYVARKVRTRGEVVFLLSALMAAVALEGLLIVVQHLTGMSFSLMGLSTAVPDGDVTAGTRSAGTLGSPNTAGAVLAMLLPAALGLLLAPVGRVPRRLAMAALGLGVPAVVLTGTRSAWLAFLLSCGLLAVSALRGRAFPIGNVIRVGLAVAALVLPLAGLVAQRLTEADPASARSRIPLARLALQMVEDHPVLGVGLNNMVVRIPDYAGPEFSRDWLYLVHNRYLLVASESGLLALAAFLWFLYAVVRCGLGCVRSGDDLLAPLASGLVAGVVGTLVTMSAEPFAGRAQVQGLWLVSALLVAMAALIAAPREASVRS